MAWLILKKSGFLLNPSYNSQNPKNLKILLESFRKFSGFSWKSSDNHSKFRSWFSELVGPEDFKLNLANFRKGSSEIWRFLPGYCGAELDSKEILISAESVCSWKFQAELWRFLPKSLHFYRTSRISNGIRRISSGIIWILSVILAVFEDFLRHLSSLYDPGDS